MQRYKDQIHITKKRVNVLIQKLSFMLPHIKQKLLPIKKNSVLIPEDSLTSTRKKLFLKKHNILKSHDCLISIILSSFCLISISLTNLHMKNIIGK